MIRISYKDEKARAKMSFENFKKSIIKHVPGDFDFEKEYKRIGGKLPK